MPTSGSLGGSLGQANRLYTDTPTTIISAQTLDAHVGNTTFLLGAMLNSKTGKLKLDTGNFVFDHYGDKDFERNISVSLQINPTRPDASGSLYYRDKQGLTYATVGAGEIIVRNAPAPGTPGTSLLALNRDAANVQKVVKNEVIDIKIPAVNLKAVIDDINNSATFLKALAADVPEDVRREGRHAEDIYLNAMMSGMSDAELRRFVTHPDFQTALQTRAAWDSIVSEYGLTSAEAMGAAALILDGESVYFKNGQAYLRSKNCTSGITPCEIAISKGLLQSAGGALTREAVLDFVNEVMGALDHQKKGTRRSNCERPRIDQTCVGLRVRVHYRKQ